MQTRLKYIQNYKNRHGKTFYYYRPPPFKKKYKINGEPDTAEFMQSYLQAVQRSQETSVPEKHVTPGSIERFVKEYLASPEFDAYKTNTKNARRNILRRFANEYGDLQLHQMERRHVRDMRDKFRDRPAAAGNFLKSLKGFLNWCVEDARVLDRNPADGVKKLKYKSKGIVPWTREDVDQYLAFHPPASRATLSFKLLLYTSVRRSDVYRLGPHHINTQLSNEYNFLCFTQTKGSDSNFVEETNLQIPIIPPLQECLDATACLHGPFTFITTQNGSPHATGNAWANKFKDWCRQADLAHLSAHGVRKNSLALMASQGCTPHEIMSISGHSSLEEVERYTKSANYPKLALAAVQKTHG